jgi:hypothetical protein
MDSPAQTPLGSAWPPASAAPETLRLRCSCVRVWASTYRALPSPPLTVGLPTARSCSRTRRATEPRRTPVAPSRTRVPLGPFAAPARRQDPATPAAPPVSRLNRRQLGFFPRSAPWVNRSGYDARSCASGPPRITHRAPRPLALVARPAVMARFSGSSRALSLQLRCSSLRAWASAPTPAGPCEPRHHGWTRKPRAPATR